MGGETECSPDGFSQFRTRTDELETLVNFFTQYGSETGFRTAKSIISVGAGDGRLDSELIRKSLPELTLYTGIECSEQMYRQLCESIQSVLDVPMSNIKASLVNYKLEQYPGPDAPADVVFMMHLLYYFGDKRCEVIQTAMDWLLPGGRLVIGVVGEGDILQKLANIGKKNLVSWVEKITQNLQTLGVKYTDHKVVHEFHPAGCDRKFAEFVLRKSSVTDFEADEILNFLPTQYEPGTTHIKHATHIFIIKKEPTGENLHP